MERNLAGALFAVFASAAVVVQLVTGSVLLRIGFAAIAMLGAILGVVSYLLERTARRVERLRVFPIRPVTNMEPYEVGVDLEAPQARADAGEGEHPEYLERDRDQDLRAALSDPLAVGRPRMVVVTGRSKAGKSRTLFEAARRELPNHQFIAPKAGANNLSALLRPGGLPTLAPGPALLWLDDLEDFVTADEGMQPRVLERDLAEWSRPVIVLATQGGKGLARRSEGEREKVTDPVHRLLRHDLVTSVELDVVLTRRELARAKALYPPRAVKRLERSGIGEYMIASDELVERLRQPMHGNGSKCPEGAAVVWAAIDWQRAGITTAVTREVLGELYRHYLVGLDPSPELFARALDWAREPLYSSIALLSGADALSPFDYIVTYADNKLRRPINRQAWDDILTLAPDESLLAVGSRAVAEDSDERAERAFSRAARSNHPELAASAAFNLGLLLSRRDVGLLLSGQAGREDEKEWAFGRAARSKNPELAALGALNLGLLLSRQEGREDDAEQAYRQALDAGGTRAWMSLGDLLSRQVGREDDAEHAYRQALHAGDAFAPFNFGAFLERKGRWADAEEVYRHAIDAGDSEAWVDLGRLLSRQGGREDDAEYSLRRAIDAEFFEAWMYLADLLSRQEGREQEAKQARWHARQTSDLKPRP